MRGIVIISYRGILINAYHFLDTALLTDPPEEAHKNTAIGHLLKVSILK